MINSDSVLSAYSPPSRGPFIDLVETTFDRTTDVIRKISGASPLNVSPEIATDLRLSPELISSLREHFNSIGFELEDDTERFLSVIERKYTAAVSTDSRVKVALLNFSPELLNSCEGVCIEAFATAVLTFREMPCRILSVEKKVDSPIESVSNLRWAYKEALKQVFPTGAHFINWDDINDFLNHRLKVSFAHLFELETGSITKEKTENLPKRLGKDEKDFIVNFLADMAASATVGVKAYFRNLVKRSDWPEPRKNALVSTWSGNADVDARELVDSIRYPCSYPSGHEKQGQSLIGWLLWDLIERQEVGYPSDNKLAKIILKYDLISRKKVLSKCQELSG